MRTFSFRTDRDGWVFISMSGNGLEARAYLDAEPPERSLIAVGKTTTEPAEAMRLLDRGEHQLRVLVPGAITDGPWMDLGRKRRPGVRPALMTASG